MEYKCLYGSKLLKLDNCSDKDYVIFVDTPKKYIDGVSTRNYPFYNKVVDNFIKGRNADGDPYKALFLYQSSKGFHEDPEYPFNFNILECKNVWIKCLKTYINKPSVEQDIIKRTKLSKKFYHLLYQYHMILEDTHFISDEAKAEVQKIHDLEMPSSYFYELRDLINSL
jgi:hypothetical protein